MKNIKSLLEIAKDLEVLASDMKKSNEDFFKNMFYLAGDIRDRSQELGGLKPDNSREPSEEDWQNLDQDNEAAEGREDLLSEEDLERDFVKGAIKGDPGNG